MEGKGRGRGGVPLLPEGMWDSLNRTDKKEEDFGAEINIDVEDTTGDRDRHAPQPSARDIPRNDHSSKPWLMKSAAPKKGAARGAEWDCASCSNVNWSWRSHCNKCNTAKPAAILTTNEIRDGVGGGFNERQDRVSAASVEVAEDGFDDFGRRVKKGHQDRGAKEAAALARLQQNYGFLLGEGALGDSDGRFDNAEEGLVKKSVANSGRTTSETATGRDQGGAGRDQGGAGRGRDDDKRNEGRAEIRNDPKRDDRRDDRREDGRKDDRRVETRRDDRRDDRREDVRRDDRRDDKRDVGRRDDRRDEGRREEGRRGEDGRGRRGDDRRERSRDRDRR